MPERALSGREDIVLTSFGDNRFKYNLKPKEKLPGQTNWVAWMGEHIGEFDLVVVDRPTDFDTLYNLRLFVHNSPRCRLAIDFDDDFTSVPKGNPASRAYKPGLVAYEA